MTNEFTFRALTVEDWKDLAHDKLEVLLDEGEIQGIKLREHIKDGTYISKPLDGGIEDCRWRRIVVDAIIPENSTFTVSFYTSNKEEPDPNWFESESIDFSNTKDALLQKVSPGRYLTLKIDFHREDGESPVLKQVKVSYPRLSYLRYLPAVYQEDHPSRDFLERFLSLFESVLHDSEETITSLPMYFDPMATPEDFDFLPWLAGWLSFDLYELLNEEKKRKFILKAIEFYQQKGTTQGLIHLVEFLTECECRIKEHKNNIFYSYGMELVDEKWGYNPRKMSRTVDTNNQLLLDNMGTYEDEIHYVIDTSETGIWSPYAISLLIDVPAGKEPALAEDKLRKIIKAFLPVFVRVIDIEFIYEQPEEIGEVEPGEDESGEEELPI